MATETSPLNRQPTKLDYSSPTQFRFLINQLPKVQYFTVSANVPGITLGEATYATPLKDIPLPGEKLTYDDLSITFIVDENLENYIEIHNGRRYIYHWYYFIFSKSFCKVWSAKITFRL